MATKTISHAKYRFQPPASCSPRAATAGRLSAGRRELSICRLTVTVRQDRAGPDRSWNRCLRLNARSLWGACQYGRGPFVVGVSGGTSPPSQRREFDVPVHVLRLQRRGRSWPRDDRRLEATVLGGDPSPRGGDEGRGRR